MKPFDEQVIREIAQSEGHQELLWIQGPSGILKPSITLGNETSFIEGAKCQYRIDSAQAVAMEAELKELRQFKEDMIRMAGAIYLTGKNK